MRLRSNEPDEQQRLGEMPPLLSVNHVASVKPGARVMAMLDNPRSEPLPAVVAQRYGAGRSLAVLVGDLWRWSLQRPKGAEDDLGKMWRQNVRWLVSDIPQRLEVGIAARDDGPSATVDLTIRVRDREYQPQENADLQVTVQQPDGESIIIDIQPSLEKIGVFTGSFVSRQSGGYRAEVIRKNADDGKPERTTVGWTSNPAADEFREIGLGRSSMQALAEETGGEIVAIEDLEEFAAGLANRPVPITETWTFPLWHRSWMLLLVLACLVGEWGLRRLRGLP
jgi:hypothetical protein